MTVVAEPPEAAPDIIEQEGYPPVERAGLGYVFRARRTGVTFTLTRVRVHSAEITGYLTVRTRLEGIRTFGDGILMVGNLNIMGIQLRKAWAAELGRRTPDFGIDWTGLLTYFSERIIAAEQGGEPIVQIGSQPVRNASGGFALQRLVPMGVATLLYAPGGSGKSQMAIGAALSVRLGREILPGFAPTIKGNVLYLDWETEGDVVADRIQRVCRGIGVPPPDIHYRHCVKPLASDAEELGVVVTNEQIKLIIVDSCGPAMGQSGEYGDANESAMKLFDALRLIGGTALVVDHVSKSEMRMGGKKRGSMPYGSIYKINRARSAWEIRPVTTLDDESLIVGLHHTKANDSRLHRPVGMKIGFHNASPTTTTFRGYEGSLDLEDDEVGPSKDEQTSAREAMVELLADGVKMQPAVIAETLGLKPGTVRSALSRNKDLFVRSGDDTWSLR